MAYATVLANVAKDVHSKALVVLPDGEQVSLQYDGTVEGLRKAVVAANQRREAFTGNRETVTPGLQVDCTPDVPTPPTPPTQAELDRTAFATAWRLFCQLDTAVSGKLIPATDAAYVAAQADIIVKWLPEYAGML